MINSVNERTFSQEVLESNRPVLVHFWAPWCGLCKLIIPDLLQLQSQLEPSIKIVSINADQNFKLANTYRLKNLPTLLLFDRGICLEKLDHFQGRDGIRPILQKMMNSLLAQSR